MWNSGIRFTSSPTRSRSHCFTSLRIGILRDVEPPRNTLRLCASASSAVSIPQTRIGILRDVEPWSKILAWTLAPTSVSIKLRIGILRDVEHLSVLLRSFGGAARVRFHIPQNRDSEGCGTHFPTSAWPSRSRSLCFHPSESGF